MGRITLGRRNTLVEYVVALTGDIVAASVILEDRGLRMTHVMGRPKIETWDHQVSPWCRTDGHPPWTERTGDVTLWADAFDVAGTPVVLTHARCSRSSLRAPVVLDHDEPDDPAVGVPRRLRHCDAVPLASSPPRRRATHVRFSSGSRRPLRGTAMSGCAMTTLRDLRILSPMVVVLLAEAVRCTRVCRADHYVTGVVASAPWGISSLWSTVVIIRVVRANQGTRIAAPNARRRPFAPFGGISS